VIISDKFIFIFACKVFVLIISDKFIFIFACKVFRHSFLHNCSCKYLSGGCMVDLIVVIRSEFGPLSVSKYEKKISQYALKLCYIIINISKKVYITICF